MKCVITGRELGAVPKPEEIVVQQIAAELMRKYGYRKENMRKELPIQMGRDTSKRADIGIFLDDTKPHTHQWVYILIECKRPNVSRADWELGRGQLHSYMDACSNAHYGMLIAGDRRVCYRSIKQPGGIYETVEVHDIPHASAPRAHFTVVTPAEPIAPAPAPVGRVEPVALDPASPPATPTPMSTPPTHWSRWHLAAGLLLVAAGVVLAMRRPDGPPPICSPCKTQEDFDRATAIHSKCCPVTACTGPGDCPSGRVCCRIPDGQLCADAPRCAPTDHVPPPPRRCALGPWDVKIRGLARLDDGMRCVPGSEHGYYLRIVFKQDEATSHAAVAHAWSKYVAGYLGNRPCPSAREMVFFDRTREAGAGILFPREPPGWGTLLAAERDWMPRAGKDEQQLMPQPVCFFRADNERERIPDGWVVP